MDATKAFNILEALEAGELDYIDEYKEYVDGHKEKVKKFADWLKTNCPELFENVDIELFDNLIEEHDQSKYSEEELEPYARKWIKKEQNPIGYSEAWDHHWLTNEHHPEHWFGEDMPYIYILEMICDWGSFSIEQEDFNELSSFYYDKARDDEEKNLSDNTKEYIEEILDLIKERADGNN